MISRMPPSIVAAMRKPSRDWILSVITQVSWHSSSLDVVTIHFIQA